MEAARSGVPEHFNIFYLSFKHKTFLMLFIFVPFSLSLSPPLPHVIWKVIINDNNNRGKKENHYTLSGFCCFLCPCLQFLRLVSSDCRCCCSADVIFCCRIVSEQIWPCYTLLKVHVVDIGVQHTKELFIT